MTVLEKKVDAIARHLLAHSPAEQKHTLEELRELMEGKRPAGGVREETVALLAEIGVPSTLFGYAYTLEAICVAVENPDFAKHGNVSKLWTNVAEVFEVDPKNVSRCIRNAVERCFANCSQELIAQYFGGTVSLDKGKLTCSEFIAECTRVIRERMGL